MKRDISSESLPHEARQALKQMGANIRQERKRLKIKQTEFATRCLLSPRRLRKLERGDPTVGLGALVQALFVLGMTDHLLSIANPQARLVASSLTGSVEKSSILGSKGKERPSINDEDLNF
jgi:transcriptional regulator with XRE-family HTH domain